jgi:tripartite ATP-independent transporter DctP family solute receptor
MPLGWENSGNTFNEITFTGGKAMKKITMFFGALALICILVGVDLVMGAEPIKIRFSGFNPPEASNSRARDYFKAELEKLTQGKVIVESFHSAVLGGAKEQVDMVKSGTLFMTEMGLAYFSGWAPALEVAQLPFLWKDSATAQKVMTGKLGNELLLQLDKAGFKGLGFWAIGYRNIVNNKRPIKEIGDFKGLKIRLQPSKVMMETFRLLGANPVPMDIKEVYSALQQGVIDGSENPNGYLLTQRTWEVTKYLTVSPIFFDYMICVANKERFNELPKEVQSDILRVMDKTTEHQWELARIEDKEAYEKLIKNGMIANKIDPTQLEAMKEVTRPVYKTRESSIGKDWIEKFAAAAR